MNKREELENMRKQHARERAEVRDNEMYIRDGEDYTIQTIRDKMARVLNDPEIDSETRKEKLAAMKEEIEVILDERDEREHNFIEQELRRHQLEQELEQEIEREEAEAASEKSGDSLNILFQARSTLNAGAEKIRKDIEENRKELNEAEQFSTILISTSERDNIPSFTKTRRKKRTEPEQAARIDTIVIKQREIGMMYKESQELQKTQLQKMGKLKETPPNAANAEAQEEE